MTVTEGEINYRYPGSRPFTDNALDRRLFFGRDEEKRYLFHSILVERLFVLFAKSGMGKTSLLNAGLMDPLRRKRFVPLTIRFNDRKSTPLKTVYTGIREAVKQKKIDYEPGETDSLWQFFKTAAFWSPDDKQLTPVLILDQFEEFFTMHSQKNRETFITQLADLVQGRVPRSLRESFKSKDHFPYSAAAPKVKIFISMREDYLGNLEEMSEAIPGILKNRFRLLPLKREYAKDAIVKPAGLTEDENVRARGFSYAAGTVDEMLDFLCARRGRSKADEVEPFQLQLLCRHVEQKVSEKSGGYKVTGKDLGGKAGMKRVLQGFYEDRIRALGPALQKRRVRKLCEKGLIDNKLRLSLEEGYIKRNYNVSKAFLTRLVDHRLLRSEPRVGSVYYELSHDTLVQPILKSAKERKTRRIRIWLPVLVVLLFLGGFAATKQVIKFVTIKNLYEDAGQDIQLGDYTNAIEKYRRVLDMAPKSRTPYLQIGELSERLKKYDDAVANYEAAIESGVKIDPAILFYRLGRIYVRYKRKTDRAVEYFNSAVELNPDLPEPHIALGDIYRKQQKFDEAREHYREALTDDDPKVDAYRGLAILFIERGKFEDALSAYKDAIKADPDYAPIYRDIAREMKKKGMKKELESLYMAASGVEDRDAAYYEKLGYDFYYLKEYDRAVEHFQNAIEIDNNRASIYKGLARVYIDQEKPTEALNVYRKAVEANPDFAYLYRDIAWLMKRKNMTADVDTLYQRASDIKTQKASYYEDLGYDLNVSQKYDSAVQTYQKALELDDKKAFTYKRLAFTLIKQGKGEEAVNVYRKAAKTGPEGAVIYKDIAKEMKRRGMENKLADLYRAASEVDLKDPDYYYAIGQACALKEIYDIAVESLKKAIRLNPQHSQAKAKLAELSNTSRTTVPR